MKKFFLILFILADLTVMAGASAYLYTYVQHKKSGVPMRSFGLPQAIHLAPRTVKLAPAVATSSAVVLGAPAAPSMTPIAPASVVPATPYRNIGFSYKNLRAKQVLIRADFTGWKGVPMKRDTNGLWSYTAQLTPGEYAYCFTVDDKIIKDPANKHTKRIAQTQVSAINVEKAPPKP